MMNSRVSPKLQAPSRSGRRTLQGNAMEFDPRSLAKISLNRDTIQALTIASAEVKVTIGPGGTVCQLFEIGTGKLLGGMDDLTKLLGIRAFVAKERKQNASSELRDDAFKIAMRAATLLEQRDPGHQLGVLDSAFIVAMRPYKFMAETIAKRKKIVLNNKNDLSGSYKDLLLFYLKGMEVALSNTVAAIVAGEKEKGLLDRFLMDVGVPSYMKTKLTTASLVLDEATDLSRLIFPQDPTKGIALTLTEWNNEAFLRRQGGILRASRTVGALLRDKELVARLSGLEPEVLGNPEDPRTQRLYKTRFHVMPIRPYKDVLTPLGRENSRGWAVPPTSMERAGSGLSAVVAVFMAAYCHTMRVAEMIPDFYDRIFPQGTIRAADDKVGNLPNQALAALDKGIESKLADVLSGKKYHGTMLTWIERECKIIPNGSLSKQIAAILKDVEDDYTTLMSAVESPPGKKEGKDAKPKLRRASMATYPVVRVEAPFSLVSEIAPTEIEPFKGFKDRHTAGKTGGKKKQRGSAATALSKGTRSFLKRIRQAHNEELAANMEAYFRGFMSRELQEVAVELAEGRFDEMEELSDLGSSDEESDSDSE